MQLENSFQVAAAPSRAWAFLLDPELVVPCMPGVELKQIIDDTHWEALARVKLGPVSMSFKGTVTLEERDDDGMRVVMKAKGTETRGQGMISAAITMQLAPVDAGSKVTVVTDLKLSGKAASFGRGMVSDVSARLTREFASNIESQLAAIVELEAQKEPQPAPPPRAVKARRKKRKKRPQKLLKPPPPKTREIGGIGLFFWAVWRAIVRFFKGAGGDLY